MIIIVSFQMRSLGYENVPIWIHLQCRTNINKGWWLTIPSSSYLVQNCFVLFSCYFIDCNRTVFCGFSWEIKQFQIFTNIQKISTCAFNNFYPVAREYWLNAIHRPVWKQNMQAIPKRTRPFPYLFYPLILCGWL